MREMKISATPALNLNLIVTTGSVFLQLWFAIAMMTVVIEGMNWGVQVISAV